MKISELLAKNGLFPVNAESRAESMSHNSTPAPQTQNNDSAGEK
jgi:hypothetical protein|tara:strand:+ start:1302 stop:1433 length:132 start_codon:yes stop_codon:yes gene_type:complete